MSRELIRLLTFPALLAAVSLLAARNAGAQAPPDRTLVIGTKSAPPFSIRSPDGIWRGISIELWQQAAQDLGIPYRLQEASLAELVDGVAAGRLDGAVGALTITSEREERVDFSHPFYTTGLAIAVPAREGSSWLSIAKRLFSLEFLSLLGALVLVLFSAGFLVWLFERRRNPDQFGGSVAKGLGSGFWWSAVTMTTVGYGDKAPVTPAGRIVALLWMFIAVIVISSFTASITSSLTVTRLEGAVRGLEDLPSVRTITVTGSTSSAFLDERQIPHRAAGTLEEALDALAARRMGAVVHDAPVLRYLVREKYADRIQILPETFGRQDYGIALPDGSPLRERLNRALLNRIEKPTWRALLERYMGR